MNDKLYTITLADGTKIEGLRLNGNNFISQELITQEMFKKKLSTVTFSSDDGEMEFHNMEVIHITKYGEEYWFVLAEIPREVLERRALRSDIDFVMMETGISI